MAIQKWINLGLLLCLMNILSLALSLPWWTQPFAWLFELGILLDQGGGGLGHALGYLLTLLANAWDNYFAGPIYETVDQLCLSLQSPFLALYNFGDRLSIQLQYHNRLRGGLTFLVISGIITAALWQGCKHWLIPWLQQTVVQEKHVGVQPMMINPIKPREKEGIRERVLVRPIGQ